MGGKRGGWYVGFRIDGGGKISICKTNITHPDLVQELAITAVWCRTAMVLDDKNIKPCCYGRVRHYTIGHLHHSIFTVMQFPDIKTNG